MKRGLLVFLALLLFGAARLPWEHRLFAERARAHLAVVPLNLDLREQIGQLGIVATLSGFRGVVADFLFIRAYIAWERTEWSRVLLLFRQATALQPHRVLFWDMAAWHMAWNAGTAALNNPSEPSQAVRRRKQQEYFALGRDFLERGIEYNPDRPELYAALARLYRDKYLDHARAAEYFALAATKPGAPSYLKRFAAYELSYCPGREREAYEHLLALYQFGEKERLPTLIRRLKFLEDKLNIPPDERIPDALE